MSFKNKKLKQKSDSVNEIKLEKKASNFFG